MDKNTAKTAKGKTVKCIVWDLDNTVWKGVLLEGDNVCLRQGAAAIIKALDERGILQSAASKNDHDLAMNKLKEFGIDEYFIYPQINWNSKSSSIVRIADSLNIGIDTIAFIDDQPFEREEVSFALPQVLCLDAELLDQLLDMEEMKPKVVTEDTGKRRLMYISEIKRKNDKDAFIGTETEFLAGLNMKFTIQAVKEGDLQRAEELTVRTNQLNTTGYTYSYEELDALRNSKNHKLLIAGLEDKYGTYGKIGLTLIECNEDEWYIKLLLMSCRVMSRGVGSILLNYIMALAKKHNVRLKAEFVENDRNRQMYITYKFAGFEEIKRDGNVVIFENKLTKIQSFPDYVTVQVDEEVAI